MPSEYTGAPFEYNTSSINVNTDNQLAAILSQFDDDYIIDIIKDSIDNRLRLYSLPRPNIVGSFEFTFKQLTNGFEANTRVVTDTRRNVYLNIINCICNAYDFEFIDHDDTDYYSIAYWLYDFLISNFTEHLKNFYTFFLIKERNAIYNDLNLASLKKDNDSSFSYSKKMFKDPKLASIHSNLEYVIGQMENFNIDLETILEHVYQSNPTLPGYMLAFVRDKTGRFFKTHYNTYAVSSKDAIDVLIQIKLSLQQVGGEMESIN